MADSEKPAEKNSKSSQIWAWVFAVIIALLLFFLLVPGTSASMKMARKNAAGGCVRQITLAYLSFAQAGGKSRNIQHGINPKNGQASNPAQYAEVLARFTGLATGEVWYIESDNVLSNKIIPATVLSQIDEGDNLLQKVSPISWAVVVGASKNLTDQYPLLWTRGLQESGAWSETSPWKKEGGHIAFGDGHVRWYDNLNLDGNHLAVFKEDAETANFREAIGPNAIVLEDLVELTATPYP